MNAEQNITLGRLLLSLLATIILPATAKPDITSYLQVRYGLDELTGTSVGDSSGNVVTGTLTGGAAFTGSALFGGGVDFDGTTGYIDCPPITATDGASQLTIAFWLNPDSLGDYDFICTKFQDLSNLFAIRHRAAATTMT